MRLWTHAQGLSMKPGTWCFGASWSSLPPATLSHTGFAVLWCPPRPSQGLCTHCFLCPVSSTFFLLPFRPDVSLLPQVSAQLSLPRVPS